MWSRLDNAMPTVDARWVVGGLTFAWIWAQGVEVAVAGLNNAFTTHFLKMVLGALLVICVLVYFPATQRFGCALTYWVFCLWVTAHSLAFSWLRHPKKFDPLPDLGHELLGKTWEDIHIPLWTSPQPFRLDAGLMPDIVLNSLVALSVLFMLTQPNRWIICRRWFSVHGTLMLFRCFTISCTSLPDAHPQCREGGQKQSPLGDLPDYLGGGSSVEHMSRDPVFFVETTFRMMMPFGGYTCGDMVFSGHTMLMILFALTFHTYYRRTAHYWALNGVKTVIWLWCFVGLASIVATRLHYTIDVLLGIYLAVTVWTCYHRIANDVLLGRQFSCVWLFDATFIYPAIRFLESGSDSDQGLGGLTEMYSEQDSSALKDVKLLISKLKDQNQQLLKENLGLKQALG